MPYSVEVRGKIGIVSAEPGEPIKEGTEGPRNINELLQSKIAEHERTEEALRASEAELHDNYFTQSAINMILSESLEDIPLEEILQKALNMILSIPWISFESIGSIHLVEDEPGILAMKAQNSLPEALIKSCAKIPFGICLCGRAALTQGIEFSGHVDERHEICYEGMTPHGHYAAPILFGGRTLGVLNIYLKEGHIRNKKEEEFLLAVVNTLAGIIVRKQVENEKEKLHHQLLQAQKMEAVGQLAGGIAHDFNNILTAIISYGSLLKMKMKEDDPLSSYADHILSSSEKAANLTQSLLAFSRKQIVNKKSVDINGIIRKSENLLVRIISEDIELKTVLTEGDLTAMADPLQIEQIFMNLATNARDAMPHGGKLEIETKIVDLDETFVKTHGYGKIGRYALISVSDTGIGMDERIRDKIFEPFFTTKEVGKGTGLGLSIVYGIIKQHGGYIGVYGEPEKGTTFNIYLPLIRTEAEEAQPKVVDIIKRGIETILLADDNSEVRAGAKAMLEEFGYKIIEATDGEDAIVKFKRYKDRIKLVILDVIMPKKNGKEAYKEIRRISPDIKVIFTSGYTADIIQQKGILSEGSGFVHKPITPQVLLNKVREILDRVAVHTSDQISRLPI